MCPLTDVEHQVSPVFVAFLAKRQEIRDTNTHHQPQNDIVKHLWTFKVAS
jgi:hypothetical protein